MVRFLALAVLAFLLFLIIRASIYSFLGGLRGATRGEAGAARRASTSSSRIRSAIRTSRVARRSAGGLGLRSGTSAARPAPTSTPCARDGRPGPVSPAVSATVDPYRAIDREADPRAVRADPRGPREPAEPGPPSPGVSVSGRRRGRDAGAGRGLRNGRRDARRRRARGRPRRRGGRRSESRAPGRRPAADERRWSRRPAGVPPRRRSPAAVPARVVRRHAGGHGPPPRAGR